MRNITSMAVISTLSCIAIILGIFALSEKYNTENQSIDILPVTTPKPAVTDTISQTPILTPQSSQSWILPGNTTSSIALSDEDGDFFTLTIEGKTYLPHMASMKIFQIPSEWLPISSLPGQDGMCVMHGHRNRMHLRVLEKVELANTITVTMHDKTVYTYTISDIKIYKNTAAFKLH